MNYSKTRADLKMNSNMRRSRKAMIDLKEGLSKLYFKM